MRKVPYFSLLLLLSFLNISFAQDSYLGPREPDCSPPGSVYFQRNSPDGVIVFWDGAAAQPGVVEYEVRYGIPKHFAGDITVPILAGNSYIIETSGDVDQLKVELRKVCYWHDGSTVLSDWVEAHAPPASKKTLPAFTCGNTYAFPSCAGPYLSSRTWTDLYSHREVVL
jgi:hypothetical protein